LFPEKPNDKGLSNCVTLADITAQTSLSQMSPNNSDGPQKNIFILLPAVYDITRVFDIIIALLSLIILMPFFLMIALIIKVSSRGPVIFSQKRVGKGNSDFTLYKFRTMYVDVDDKGSLTIGNRNSRVTAIGCFLRRYKLDELPQLYNVLKNEMSIVGPRPELRKFVELYSNPDREILFIKPGITDYASILFRRESELLASKSNPEQHYIETVVPMKIRLSKKYANNKTVKNYFIIIVKTVFTVVK
jgi:lipopolysaccharide/colanic/teichoic acid biosynthesis glycosyltransferase